MNIGWIADHFYPEVCRGAEIHDKILIEEGERRGHQITRMGKLNKQVDLFVLSNFVDNFNIGEVFAYLSQKPYVNFIHDLRSPQYEWFRTLASEALFNVCLSPLQLDIIKRINGEFPAKYHIQPTCMLPVYKDYGWQRLPENEVLYVGDYNVEKGYSEMVEWLDTNQDCRIWHIGGGFDKSHARMVEVGQISQKWMPFVYNTFSSMIFLPRYVDVCSRVMAEAFLCRIRNVVSNDRDGFSSWGFKQENYEQARQILVNGHKTFWKVIEDNFVEKMFEKVMDRRDVVYRELNRGKKNASQG